MTREDQLGKKNQEYKQKSEHAILLIRRCELNLLEWMDGVPEDTLQVDNDLLSDLRSFLSSEGV